MRTKAFWIVAAGRFRLWTRRNQIRVPWRPVAELAARMLEEAKYVFGNTRRPPFGIARNQTQCPVLVPPVTPLPDGLSVQPESATGGQYSVFDGVRDNGGALLHPEPIAWSDAVLPLPWHGTSSLLPAILQRGSHSQVDFSFFRSKCVAIAGIACRRALTSRFIGIPWRAACLGLSAHHLASPEEPH